MLSIVIPIYNEATMLPLLMERLDAALKAVPGRHEILFVDDGSSDNSVEVLHELQQGNSVIRIIELSRNFGHQAALTAGLDLAEGDYIAMMDADLQDPPELLAEMHSLLSSGEWDVVSGYRTERKESWSRQMSTRFFHWLFAQISGLEGIESTGHFSMMTRRALEAIRQMKEKTRYLPGLRSYIGFRQTQIAYSRDERKAGTSKMSTGGLLRLAADALFSFSRVPLRICLWLGVLGVVLFFLAGLHVLLSKMMGWAPIGWSSTIISIFFLGSVQLTFLGVLGEYLYRTYKESQNRPIYFIKNIS